MTAARKKPSRTTPSYYEFPYVKLHGRSYPLIPVTLRHDRRAVNTFALLDSGASVSVFRPEIARILRLGNVKGAAVRMATPVGGVDIEMHKVEVLVQQSKFKANIGFSKKYAASFNILGREGFFRHFSICFNEIMRTVVLVPLKGLHS
jgi:hypothetical protein